MSDEIDLRVLGARAVLDSRGQSRLLGSLWRNQPAVLVWLRHFACLFCKEQAAEARHDRRRLEDIGGRLAFIGSGTTAQAAAFREHHVPDCAVFTDPSSYTYRAIGARESLLSTLAGAVVNGPRAIRRGHLQSAVQRRPFQQGGVLVAMPDASVAYSYVSRVAGDHPPMERVLAALAEATCRTAARTRSEERAWRSPAASPGPRPAAPFRWQPPPHGRPVDGGVTALPPWPTSPGGAGARDGGGLADAVPTPPPDHGREGYSWVAARRDAV